jgi:Uma2 family endonuclease
MGTAAPSRDFVAPRPKRFSRAEYYRLIERGAFEGHRVQLLRGELMETPPMHEPHAMCITRLSYWLMASLRPEFEVRIQMPFDVDGDSVPEPDALVCRSTDLSSSAPPGRADLIIEVADTSLRLDRQKAEEYAGRCSEYWIVNLQRREIEVHRSPMDGATAVSGRRFSVVEARSAADSSSPLCKPAAATMVRGLLPPGGEA